MALNAYLRVVGQDIGDVDGGSTQTGREGLMEVYGFAHEVVSPRDAASGRATGKRQHKPFTIVKPVDKATPLLMSILVNNENITEWELQCFQPNAAGAEENFYTIKLTNATIAGVRTEQLNNKYPENMAHEIREHVTFTYERIEWVSVTSTRTAVDTWEDPDDA